MVLTCIPWFVSQRVRLHGWPSPTTAVGLFLYPRANPSFLGVLITRIRSIALSKQLTLTKILDQDQRAKRACRAAVDEITLVCRHPDDRTSTSNRADIVKPMHRFE